MKYFGTDGFRGEANVFLTVEHAYKIGRYLGWYYNREHKAKIVLGKDTRRSSYMLEYALVSGLTASGADVYLLHVTTTPSIAYVTRTEDFDCGIMISASHNPYYDNGIKIIDSNGHKLSSDLEEKIEAYIDNKTSELPLAVQKKIGTATDYSIGRNRYVGYLISTATRSFKNMRIGLDCANGSASSIAKSVFDALGAKTYVVAIEPDGTNINQDCGSTHIENLRSLVKEQHLDLGFAFDGDADRCIAIDEFGNEINGDHILYICGKYLKEKSKLNDNTIVATIMSNLGLFKALEKESINYVKTTVGDKYVNEEMVKHSYSLGGEQSGHIIFSKHSTTGDGILTSLMVMEAVIEKKTTLGNLAKEMTMYPQKVKNIVVEDKKAVITNEVVIKLEKMITKELGDEGRILLRESGTEPVIRIMVEAKTEHLCDKFIKQMTNVIKNQKLLIDN
ncbi:phosphoglucosamine mutase [Anaerosporobacter mobilis DSM 15930]|uniref:Phosphoglucosamine mutase n=1 Tax=Anaerosporobacter mobilis DSM 15930 TaxID=1120996 RepID=A0A1M7LDK8_9FIRM|nr:phosphoglucosamine mutase [Anaerosporobacter mobilis]SHM75987.1 phosphoglucosamine mutase [Anaerosporobacter mobilis DSM 15930]